MAGLARKLAVRLALMLMGAGLALSGVVLLLRAAWVALALPLGPMWASVLMGGVLLLLGGVLLGLAARRKRGRGLSDPDLMTLVTNAFLQGLAAGRASGHGRRPEGE